MLSPNDRSTLTAALTPPPGWRFDEAIGTTFSLDPTTLLGVPIHLALLGSKGRADLQDGLKVLEALRRVSERLTIYAQRGRMSVPRAQHVLYGMLERMVVEVAPKNGVFHPKLWLLRFVDESNEYLPMLRLLVLSRNLTTDRSWDLALQLEGQPDGRRLATNRELARLIAALPELAEDGMVDEARIEQAQRLAEEVRRTEWILPQGFDEVTFHSFGLGKRSWRPEWSAEAAVISPFCSDEALQEIADATETPMALVSRPDTLDALLPETLARFERCLVLDEAAETEDGEDTENPGGWDSVGLHAKAYIFRRGWHTHLLVGSANATNAGLRLGRNVEVLAELRGKHSVVGRIANLLDEGGFGAVLRPYERPSEPLRLDEARLEAERALEEARDALVAAALSLRCVPIAENQWRMELSGSPEKPPEGPESLRVWPLSVQPHFAVDAGGLWQQDVVALRPCSAVSLTGLIAFELVSAHPDVKLTFALNLPIEGVPDERDAELMRLIVQNEAGFLRYLMLLLGDDEDGILAETVAEAHGGTWGLARQFDELPLLEKLTRTFARHPERLGEVEDVLERLRVKSGEETIVSPAFEALWSVFEEARGRQHVR